MTTIAWDGKTLAGDRRAHVDLTPAGRTRKVYRVVAPNGRVALVGFAGSVAYARAYLHWLAGGDEPDRAGFAAAKWAVMMVDDSKRVYVRVNETNAWDDLGRIRWAIGSGRWLALGAMAHGASAREALKIATKLDYETGDGVDVVRF